MDAVVAQRGQVTIPKALRERLGIGPGTVLEFHVEDGRLIAVKRKQDHPALAMLGKRGRGRRTADVMEELRGEAG